MKKIKPETISLGKLRGIANSKGDIKNAAKKALREAEYYDQNNCLSSIVLDRHLRTIQVYKTRVNV